MRRDILEEVGGSIVWQELQGQPIVVPSRRVERPDGGEVGVRWERFLGEGEGIGLCLTRSIQCLDYRPNFVVCYPFCFNVYRSRSYRTTCTGLPMIQGFFSDCSKIEFVVERLRDDTGFRNSHIWVKRRTGAPRRGVGQTLPYPEFFPWRSSRNETHLRVV